MFIELVTGVGVLCLLNWLQALECCVYYWTGYRCWGVVLTGLVTGAEASCLLFDWVQVLDWLYEVGPCVYWTGS